jgi:hypothetical protein
MRVRVNDDTLLPERDGRDSLVELRPSNRVGFLFDVPGEFDPCGRFDYESGAFCDDRARCVEFVQGNSGFRIVCGSLHHHDFKGKSFISPIEFEPGADLADVALPPELRPSAAKIKQARWKVSSAAAKRLGPYKVCAVCEVPELTGYRTSDTSELIEWISLYDPDLQARVRAELSNKPGVAMRDWYAEISVPLRTEIIKRLSLSVISIDHGIPRKVGNATWARLSAAARTLLRESMLFPVCRKCNLGKSASLLPVDRLVDLYAQYNYDSLALAKADLVRWDALQEIIAVVYEEAAS